MTATLVVGTAGHIDHGKTSLVRALTGVDLDTLPEEVARGITIALGFTALDLPERRIAFVDVPGHERLVRTMAAGAHGLDAALLVVSAVDGVMPQTREHLAILDLLGVPAGVVALTKADLVDDELRELALADVEELLEGTVLEAAPVVVTSTTTGEGLDRLREALATLQPRADRTQGPFRLPIDRSFTRPGFGTVATGTARGDALHDGATVHLSPEGTSARVRGLQQHGEAVETAHGGHRVAVNLAGVDVERVPRGTVVSTTPLPCPSILDVHYRHVHPEPATDGLPIRVLCGTAERIGRLVLGDPAGRVEPGEATFAQVRVDAPLPCLPGDRFVIRLASPMRTLGGGVVLDPWAPKLRRAHAHRWTTELERLADGDQGVYLERAGETGLPPAEATRRAPGADAITLGDTAFAPAVVTRLEGLLLEAMVAFHAASPLSLGAGRRELRRGRLGHLSERVFDGLVDRLGATGTLLVEGALVRAKGFAVALSAEQQALHDAVLAAAEAAGLGGVTPHGLRTVHDHPALDAVFHLLTADGRLVAVPKHAHVPRTALEALRGALVGWYDHHESMAPTDFKALSGLSRKGAIPLLEALDRWAWTRRVGEGRAEGPRLRGGHAPEPVR